MANKAAFFIRIRANRFCLKLKAARPWATLRVNYYSNTWRSKLAEMGSGIRPLVIPGHAKREPGIHNHDREYGFRARAKWRAPE
jgi:hypothetical protein